MIDATRLPLAIPAGLAAVLVVCSTAPTALPSDRLRILFIGNSLTASDTLPEAAQEAVGTR